MKKLIRRYVIWYNLKFNKIPYYYEGKNPDSEHVARSFYEPVFVVLLSPFLLLGLPFLLIYKVFTFLFEKLTNSINQE